MAGERTPGPVCQAERPSRVQDGTMCVAPTAAPGAVGLSNHTPPGVYQVGYEQRSEEGVSSAVAVGSGIGSIARIPVPGTNGLFVELSARGWKPQGGSTSTLFIQDAGGGRHLRLDYGYNKTTGRVDYHWNQSGTFEQLGIKNHSPTGAGGEALYRGAKCFRYGGRALLVIGLAVDVYSIVVAKRRWRQVARVAAGWAGAWGGCEAVGAGGAALGTFVEPGGGTAVGAFVGCVVGGIGGYAGASWAAGQAYDWVEETYFERLPETSGDE